MLDTWGDPEVFVMANLLREIWYEGHVQGVGFRYTVAGIARSYAVTGYVRNLTDGRVQLVCEGDGPELQAFLEEIDDRMRSFIREKKEDTRPATGQFLEFEIRH